MTCRCFGIKIAVFGALIVINEQGVIWSSIASWTFFGILLVILGIVKAVMPRCPLHDKGMAPNSVMKKAK